MESKPYALGFNGHAKKCDCPKCCVSRMREFKKYVRSTMRTMPVMTERTKTVFVRPHWRNQPNHLNKQPLFKRLIVREYF